MSSSTTGHDEAYIRGRIDGLFHAQKLIQDTACVMAFSPMAVVQTVLRALVQEAFVASFELEQHSTNTPAMKHKEPVGEKQVRKQGDAAVDDDLIHVHREAERIKFVNALLSESDHEALYEDIDLSDS